MREGLAAPTASQPVTATPKYARLDSVCQRCEGATAMDVPRSWQLGSALHRASKLLACKLVPTLLSRR